MVKPIWGQYLLSVSKKNDSVIELNLPCYLFFFIFRELFAGLGTCQSGTLPQDVRLASDCLGSDRLDEETKLKT